MLEIDFELVGQFCSSLVFPNENLIVFPLIIIILLLLKLSLGNYMLNTKQLGWRFRNHITSGRTVENAYPYE